tara:strand:+ start:1752 stop:2612 length:861 start_codon:yes stop_codon:yes gene_type:complete
MKEIVGVITKKKFVTDDIIKDILTILGGKNPVRLGESACEFCISELPSNEALETARDLKADINFVKKCNREKQVIVADMDGTLIIQESLDELAEFVGFSKVVADLTKQAMQGDLSFEISIRERVKLLAGVRQESLESCFQDRISLSDGAETLMRTMNARNAFTVIVSGGLKYFVSRVARSLKVSTFFSNDVATENGVLTGKLIMPIFDGLAKFKAVENVAKTYGVGLENIMAVGDGANDLEMLQAVGLGVANKAQKVVKMATNVHIDHSDLTALLFLQGISERYFK